MTDDSLHTTGFKPTQEPPAGMSRPVLPSQPLMTLGDIPTSQPGQTPVPEAPRGATSDGRLAPDELVKGRYRVIRHIASGGMGEVYEVFDNVSQEKRAIKLMKSHLLSSAAARERFIKESKVQDLRHPYIVKTIDIDEWPERNTLFIAMELVPGQTLRQWMRDAAQAKPGSVITVADSLEICRQICAALAYAHRVTIHRDIKPENILVERLADGRWQARVADFGITKLLEVADFTATNQVFGTFQYMAPEQQRDAGSVDHRADIYSVGVVLYELLTSQLPQGRFKLPSECGGSIPRETDTLITRALASDRNDRYADMAMMQADVERVLRGVTGTAAPRAPSEIPVQLPSTGDLGKIVIELQERRMPQVTVVGLPPIPDDILRLRARVEDLDQAIRDLEQEIHPVLRPHLEALAQITAQCNSTLADLKAHPLYGDAPLRSRLEQLINDRGIVETTGLKTASGQHDISEVLSLVTQIRNMKVATKHRESGYQQYRDAKAQELTRLKNLREEGDSQMNTLCEYDLHSILSLIETNLDPFSTASLPLATWSTIAKRFNEQGRYHWDQWETFNRAEKVWSQIQSERAWDAATTKQTAATWRQFMCSFPQSAQADYARIRLSDSIVEPLLDSQLDHIGEEELSCLAAYLREGVGNHLQKARVRYHAVVDVLIDRRSGEQSPFVFRLWRRWGRGVTIVLLVSFIGVATMLKKKGIEGLAPGLFVAFLWGCIFEMEGFKTRSKLRAHLQQRFPTA